MLKPTNAETLFLPQLNTTNRNPLSLCIVTIQWKGIPTSSCNENHSQTIFNFINSLWKLEQRSPKVVWWLLWRMQTESVKVVKNYFRCQYGGEAPKAKTIRELLNYFKKTIVFWEQNHQVDQNVRSIDVRWAEPHVWSPNPITLIASSHCVWYISQKSLFVCAYKLQVLREFKATEIAGL